MTNRKTQSMNNNNKIFHGFENCTSRLTLLNCSRKPHKWTRTSRADLTSSPNEEKPSIKPHERQGVSFLLSYSDMALISFRMPPA